MFFDFTKNFTSIRKDINKVSEDNSILESIENIVSMNTGDVVGNNLLGSNTKRLLFKSNSPFILFDFVKQIEFSLYTYEKRITDIDITARFNEADDVLDLTIRAVIKNDKKKDINFSKRF